MTARATGELLVRPHRVRWVAGVTAVAVVTVFTVVAVLLRGEDPEFQSYLRRIAEEERGALITLA